MIDDLVYKLWGKTNELGKGKPVWACHPAICHMVDVGHMAEVWLKENPWLFKRFCMLAPEIESEELLRIIITIVALHDLGKVHFNFQSKSKEGWKYGYGLIGLEPIADCKGFDHGRETALLIRDLGMSGAFPSLLRWRRAFDMVAGHHGTLYERQHLDPEQSRIGIRDLERAVATQVITLLSELFGMPKELPAPPKNPGFLMLLAGFCSVADWLGSDSTLFTFQPIRSKEDLIAYLQRLRDDKIGERQLRYAGLLARYKTETPTFATLFSWINEPNLLQKEASKIPFGDRPGGELIIVEAAMGIGKTEIALYLAARALAAGNAAGIYFALPTQASSNILFKRIYGFADAIHDPDSAISLALAHGGRRNQQEYIKLTETTENRWKQLERSRAARGAFIDEGAPIAEVVAPAWLHGPRQTLLASIGVGTIDQSMLGAILVKHSFVRLFALAGKVVIFDEIHAYDLYMDVLIQHLLRWLHALGTKVILLSATLPRTLRGAFLKTYGVQTSNGQADAGEDRYPQILYLDVDGKFSGFSTDEKKKDGEEEKTTVDGAKKKEPPVVTVATIDSKNEERTKAGAERVWELAKPGGCVAWIRNTVKEVQDAWGELLRLRALAQDKGEEEVDIAILHARYTREDRAIIQDNLVGQLEKDAKERRPRRLIVVASQVIEQSVDLDFDAMVSDLAPVDLLLQRSGRLWRHKRSLDERGGHTAPMLYVLVPDKEEHHQMKFGPSSYVYDAEILARTATLLHSSTDEDLNPPDSQDKTPSRWQMPDACRTLVADLYDRTEEYWTAEQMGVEQAPLDLVRRQREKDRRRMEESASMILMPPPDPDNLDFGMRDTRLSDDERGDRLELTTRYGNASVTAVLLRRRGNSLELAGRPDLSLDRLPSKEERRGAYDLEDGVMRSSVSFPTYQSFQPGGYPDPTVHALEAWWGERHAYDRKIFLIVEPDGTIAHPELQGHYRWNREGYPLEGLVIEKLANRKEKDRVSYETI